MELETRTTKRETIETEIVVTDKRGYQKVFTAAQLIGLVLAILIFVWVFGYLDGVNFDKPAQLFNFHPILMIVSLIIYSNGILLFRTLRNQAKNRLKKLHAVAGAVVIVLGGLGVAAAIVYHSKANIAHFYTVHSWLGLSTLILFVSQFFGGFYSFLWPGASYKTRGMVMPYHRYMGGAIFALAVATCMTGLNEKAIFSLGNNYAKLGTAAVLINVSVILLLLYGVFVLYCVYKQEYKRFPITKDLRSKNGH